MLRKGAADDRQHLVNSIALGGLLVEGADAEWSEDAKRPSVWSLFTLRFRC
jgi:hypothetical protein